MLEIALGLATTVYDSLYLAVAQASRCRLVTADKQFHDRIKRSRLAGSVVWVEDV